MATASASIIPALPPSSEPMAMKSAVMAAIRTAVFNRLNMRLRTPQVVEGVPREMRARRASSSRQAQAPARQRRMRLQEGACAGSLAAGALQLLDAQRLVSGGHDQCVAVGRHDLAGRAPARPHVGAPHLDRLVA